MKSLSFILLEDLSNETIQKLEQYVTNDNINDVLKVLKRNSDIISNISRQDYLDFFKLHGLSDLNWGRKNSVVKQFVNLFTEEDHIDVFNNIIMNNGIISIDKLPETGNIFDFCGSNKKMNPCGDFTEEAKIIASWTNGGSANVGPCEILLKFILKEGRTGKSGDVSIAIDENDPEPKEEMEVKASMIKKETSGGHPAGQKGKIRNSWSIYWYLDKHLFNLKTSSTDADKLSYFQNKAGVSDFNKKLLDANVTSDQIAKELVNAICYQYRFIEGENDDTPKDLNGLDKLYEETKKLVDKSFDSKKGFVNEHDLYNIVGCIQLYLYSQVEGFDYFFVILLDKNIDNEAAENGKYWCAKNCGEESTSLLDFNIVLSHLRFKTLDSTTTSQGRTGKIIIKR